MIIKNKNTTHRSSAAIIGDVAAKLGCDISGSTDDVDLCMVTHCRNPIGYAVLCGNQWSRIPEQEFNKLSKPSKPHAGGLFHGPAIHHYRQPHGLPCTDFDS